MSRSAGRRSAIGSRGSPLTRSGGRPNVARYDTVLTLPAAAHGGDLEAPTAYLRNEFSHLFTLDARSGVLERT